MPSAVFAEPLMRLIYIVDHFPRLTERFVLTEVLELIAHGDKLIVVVRNPDYDPDPEATEVPVLRLPQRRMWSVAPQLARDCRFRVLRALWWAVRARRHEREALRAFGEAAYLVSRLPPSTEMIHAHFAHGAATVALLLARLSGRPFSFTAHAYDLLVATHPRTLRMKAADASSVIAVSEFTAARLRELAGPHAHKVVVVRNGVYPHPPPARRAERDDPPLVIAVARLVPKKGLDTLVRACSRLADGGSSWRCEIVGEGPERPYLESLVDELQLVDRVKLLGALPHAEVLLRLERARVFALPCRRAEDGDEDALPVALVEALAAGVPVVTTSAGGIGEAIVDGVCGRLVGADEPAALASAIAELLHDDTTHARLAASARTAARRYDPARTIPELRRVFQHAVDAR